MPGYKVEVQMKQRKVQVDEWFLEELLKERGIPRANYMKEVIDHDLVEQLYIEGTLTDDDLRQCNGGSQIIPTLTVSKEDDDV